jgi:hypothetical protein
MKIHIILEKENGDFDKVYTLNEKENEALLVFRSVIEILSRSGLVFVELIDNDA